jgi:chemotaxis protein CheD
MQPRSVLVRMGEGTVGQAPDILVSQGIGSCVVVALYDPCCRIGGLAHIMLPDCGRLIGPRPAFHCADTAIATLLDAMCRRGAARREIVAKIVGGARMFASSNGRGSSIGKENIRSTKKILTREQILLVGQDTGGRSGRNMELCLETGMVTVSKVGRKLNVEL